MEKDTNAYRFVFAGDKLLLCHKEGVFSVPRGMGFLQGTEVLPIGRYEGTPCLAASVQGVTGENYEAVSLRQAHGLINADLYALAGKAAQMLYWNANSRYCPVCGTSTVPYTEIARRCPVCGKELYPPVSPVAIVLVRKGDSILLVHTRCNKYGTMGPVSGFAEPGETLEECVIREVMEETGISVNNIRYFGSQSWPYPSNLMVGFMADYAGGEIRLQAEELDAGGFFTRDSLPELPSPSSIARRMIDAWLGQDEQRK